MAVEQFIKALRDRRDFLYTVGCTALAAFTGGYASRIASAPSRTWDYTVGTELDLLLPPYPNSLIVPQIPGSEGDLSSYFHREGVGFGRMELMLPEGEDSPEFGGYRIHIPANSLTPGSSYSHEYTYTPQLKTNLELTTSAGVEGNLLQLTFTIGGKGDTSPKGRSSLELPNMDFEIPHSFMALWREWKFTRIRFDELTQPLPSLMV